MRFYSLVVNKIEKSLASFNPWQNTFGIVRSILAFGLLSSLLFNGVDFIFRFGPGNPEVPICKFYNSFGLFCLLNDNLVLAKWISIISLIIVGSGYRPRFTCLLHWYITYSYTTSATLLDGGDHIGTILTFLIIPIGLTDNRKWHWQKSANPPTDEIWSNIRKIIAGGAVIAIKLQVAIIYLNAAAAKLFVKEWMDGTAVYYWFTHPTFGLPLWLRPISLPALQNSHTITVLTWSVMVYEFLLFAGILAKEKYKRLLLFSGIAFHFSIVVVHGLFSFFFTMVAALILYLGPLNRGFNFTMTKPDIFGIFKRNTGKTV